MSTRVAVCQAPDIREDIERSLEWIERFTDEAAAANVSLICFPECFLQGYLTEKNQAEKFSINLGSPVFKTILQRLAGYRPMIVFGLIEEDDGLLYNSALVIKEGELIGKYRKTHLLDGESIFTAGTEYPLFKTGDLKFGINICYDTQFPEATAKFKEQDVELVLCLSNTMMSCKKAGKFKSLHLPMRAERVKEQKVWMLSSDITGEMEGSIAYGTTSAISPDAEIVQQIPFMETGMIIVDI